MPEQRSGEWCEVDVLLLTFRQGPYIPEIILYNKDVGTPKISVIPTLKNVEIGHKKIKDMSTEIL